VIDLHEKLKEYNFTFSHNSYLVNMAHIQHIQGCEIQLDSGEILTISRSMRDTFRKTYHEYIERKY
jgi:DNA-binding LytR/AlgR family response regulator